MKARSEKEIQHEADWLYAGVFVRICVRWQDVLRFWNRGNKGFDSQRESEAQLVNANLDWVERTPDMLENPPEFQRFRQQIDLDQLASVHLDGYKETLDTACLVLLVAELDVLALDCCRICSLLNPQSFLPDTRSEKLRFQNAQQQIGCILEDLGRGDLAHRIMTVLKACNVSGDDWDCVRLEKIRGLRNDIVHRPGTSPRIDDLDAIQQDMRDCGLRLFKLLNATFGLKIHSEMFKEQILQSARSLS
jgi:hypothetical protein